MQGRWMRGGYLTEIIADCFRPDVDVCVFRDGETDIDGNPKNIYRGPAKDLPSLQGYTVIDIQYDWYQLIFFIEVK